MRMANKWLRDFERPIFRLKNHEIKKTGQITFTELEESSLPKPIIRIAREVTWPSSKNELFTIFLILYIQGKVKRNNGIACHLD